MINSKILIVEDEGVVALDIQGKLEDMGYNVVDIASSGDEALQIVDDKYPDLVLMDIVLKGEMDGIETAEQILEHFKTPVIYITSYADNETLQRAKITEPSGYILKPVREQELQAVIQIALHKYEKDRELKRTKKQLEEKISEFLFQIPQLIKKLENLQIELTSTKSQLQQSLKENEELKKKLFKGK